MTGWAREIALAARLSAKDFFHERRLSLCAALGLAAILAPLFVLYGLKYGIIAHMSETLSQDPRARELRPLGHGVHDRAFIDALAARPDVGFVIPTTRFLSATVSLRQDGDGGGGPLATELWPTRPGDPYLEGVLHRDLTHDEIVLTAQAARALNTSVGGTLVARVGRRIGGVEESARVRVRVVGVLPSGLIERDVAFSSLGLLLATEDYREGHAVDAFGWPGKPLDPLRERSFASFRIFAKELEGVEPLSAHLAGMQIQTLTRIADIRMIQNLDAGLAMLFAVIAGLGVFGYILSLYVSLVAMVERKRMELAALRLLGFSSLGVALFPTVNAALSATFGSIVAAAAYVVIEPILNDNLFLRFGPGVFLTNLEARHLLAGAGMSLVVCLAAAAFAGAKAAALEPARGLRDV